MIFRSSSVGCRSIEPCAGIDHPDLRGHLLHRIATLILTAVSIVLSVDAGNTALGAEKRSVPNIVLILADDKY
jgi:hypothetical protein